MSTRLNQKPQDLFLLEGISCVTFNKDFTEVALSKKDNLIYIYSVKDIKKPETWKLIHTLDNHFQYISGLDWCPETNRLLSCSYDKTSFVWDLKDNKWTPSNVVVTTKLGYLCCKWNKRGDKFCEGTSAKQLIIGYYNTDSQWWMGKPLKALVEKKTKSLHHSSVVTCEIDPTSLFVLSGSTDLKVCVTSCYLSEVDDKFLTDQTKPLVQEFGTVLFQFKAECWVNSVAWLPSGNLGIAAGQNATISVIDYKDQKSDLIRCKHSPATQLIPIDDNSFYAVCYDRNILQYEKKGENWEVKKVVTDKGDDDKKAKTTVGSVSKALAQFQQMGNIKKENLAVTSKQAAHLHKSIISSATVKGKEMITTDVSGFVKYWKL